MLVGYVRLGLWHAPSRRRGSCLGGVSRQRLHLGREHVQMVVTWVKFYGEFAVCLLDFQLGGGGRHLQGIVVLGIDHHGCLWEDSKIRGCDFGE